jgi:hypothetical protein
VRPTSSAILPAQSPARPGFIREQPAARHDIFEWFQPILFWHRTASSAFLVPQFSTMKAIDSRLYIRYTYGGG